MQGSFIFDESGRAIGFTASDNVHSTTCYYEFNAQGDRCLNEAISTNGKHYGYLFEGNVYCVVYPEGKPEHIWIKSFHADPYYLPPVVTYY